MGITFKILLHKITTDFDCGMRYYDFSDRRELFCLTPSLSLTSHCNSNTRARLHSHRGPPGPGASECNWNLRCELSVLQEVRTWVSWMRPYFDKIRIWVEKYLARLRAIVLFQWLLNHECTSSLVTRILLCKDCISSLKNTPLFIARFRAVPGSGNNFGASAVPCRTGLFSTGSQHYLLITKLCYLVG